MEGKITFKITDTHELKGYDGICFICKKITAEGD